MKIRSLLIALALLTLLGGGAWYVVARKAAPGGAPAAPAAQGGTGAVPAPVGPLEFDPSGQRPPVGGVEGAKIGVDGHDHLYF